MGENNLEHSQKKAFSLVSITISKLQARHSDLIISNNLNILLIYLVTLELCKFNKKEMYLIIVTDKRTLLRQSEGVVFKMFTQREIIVVLMSSRLWVVLQI